MLKFRAAIILISLIIMFLVPMTAIKTEPKAEKPPETENEQPKEQENEKERGTAKNVVPLFLGTI